MSQISAKKLKKKVIALIVTAVVLVTAAVTYTVRTAQMRLDEPVFLTHYYDMKNFFRARTLILNYITNRSDNRTVTAVSFPESPNLPISFDGESSLNTYRYHKSNRIFLHSDIPAETELAPTTLTKVHIEFSDGTEGDFNIGHIVVENDPSSSKRLIGSQSVGTSNMGDTTETFLAFEDCRLTDIIPFFEEGEGLNVNTQINGISDYILPIEIHKDDMITFDTDVSAKDGHEFNVYNLDKTIVLEDIESNVYYEHLSNIGYTPNFSDSGVVEFLRQRGAI